MSSCSLYSSCTSERSGPLLVERERAEREEQNEPACDPRRGRRAGRRSFEHRRRRRWSRIVTEPRHATPTAVEQLTDTVAVRVDDRAIRLDDDRVRIRRIAAVPSGTVSAALNDDGVPTTAASSTASVMTASAVVASTSPSVTSATMVTPATSTVPAAMTAAAVTETGAVEHEHQSSWPGRSQSSIVTGRTPRVTMQKPLVARDA